MTNVDVDVDVFMKREGKEGLDANPKRLTC